MCQGPCIFSFITVAGSVIFTIGVVTRLSIASKAVVFGTVALSQMGGPNAFAQPPQLTGDRLQLFNEHNRHRADHCTPALTWSAKLAADAQTSANRCPMDHNRAELNAEHENENLYHGSGSASFTGPKAAIDFWYGEIKDYNFNAPVLVFDGPMNGHFTQVVWKNTTQIGCATKVCGNTTHWVCRYAPPGNFNAHTPETPATTAVANLNANVLKKCR